MRVFLGSIGPSKENAENWEIENSAQLRPGDRVVWVHDNHVSGEGKRWSAIKVGIPAGQRPKAKARKAALKANSNQDTQSELLFGGGTPIATPFTFGATNLGNASQPIQEANKSSGFSFNARQAPTFGSNAKTPSTGFNPSTAPTKSLKPDGSRAEESRDEPVTFGGKPFTLEDAKALLGADFDGDSDLSDAPPMDDEVVQSKTIITSLSLPPKPKTNVKSRLQGAWKKTAAAVKTIGPATPTSQQSSLPAFAPLLATALPPLPTPTSTLAQAPPLWSTTNMVQHNDTIGEAATMGSVAQADTSPTITGGFPQSSNQTSFSDGFVDPVSPSTYTGGVGRNTAAPESEDTSENQEWENVDIEPRQNNGTLSSDSFGDESKSEPMSVTFKQLLGDPTIEPPSWMFRDETTGEAATGGQDVDMDAPVKFTFDSIPPDQRVYHSSTITAPPMDFSSGQGDPFGIGGARFDQPLAATPVLHPAWNQVPTATTLPAADTHLEQPLQSPPLVTGAELQSQLSDLLANIHHYKATQTENAISMSSSTPADEGRAAPALEDVSMTKEMGDQLQEIAATRAAVIQGSFGQQQCAQPLPSPIESELDELEQAVSDYHASFDSGF